MNDTNKVFTRDWMVRQYLATILALLGFVSTGFTAMVALSYSNLAQDTAAIKQVVPILQERVSVWKQQNDADKIVLANIQQIITLQDRNLALLQHRLDRIDRNLSEFIKTIKPYLQMEIP